MKILHIGHDSQFTQFAANAFEDVMPGANNYVILTRSGEGPLQFPIAEGPVVITSSAVSGAFRAQSHIGQFDMIVAHSMTLHSALAFGRSDARTVRVWSGWGSDYYGDDESPNGGLLGPKTLQVSQDIGSSLERSVSKIKGRLRTSIRRRAASSTDIFSAPIPNDLEILTARFPQFQGTYHQLHYASVENTFTSGSASSSGADILVGNSASFANNHLEAFDLLADCDIRGRRIVVPLSYGNARYRDVVLSRGEAMFGSAFFPLVDFLPIEKYIATISNCGVIIMNHRRQQALGNIGAALYHGAHLYLAPENPALHFLRSQGITIRSTAAIVESDLPRGPVELSEMERNRSILNDLWGSRTVRESIQRLVRQVQV